MVEAMLIACRSAIESYAGTSAIHATGGRLSVTKRAVGANAEAEVKDTAVDRKSALGRYFEMFVQQSPVIERTRRRFGRRSSDVAQIAEMPGAGSG